LVVDKHPPNSLSLYSLAERQLYPYLATKHRHRTPAILKPWQISNLHLASQHATKIKLPLNTFVSIAWLATEHGDIHPDTFTKCRQRACQYLRRNAVKPAWLFVHENPIAAPGDTKPNTHMLVHVPSKLKTAFKAKLPDWFDAIMDGAVKAEPRTRPGYVGPDRLLYMSKGGDDFTCRRHGGRRSRGGQGVVWCKRSGVSQNLGWKARATFPPTKDGSTFTLTKGSKP